MADKIEHKRARTRYRGSLVGPMILIMIGVVFLLSNLGYITGNIWDTILNLWPLILITIGLDNVLYGRGVTGPLLFIGLGVMILLSNFEVISWNIWDLFLKLWPIFLIAIGLDLIIGRRSIWGAIVAITVLIVILIIALWYFGSGPGLASSEAMDIVQYKGDVDQASIILKPTVASVSIGTLSSSENLLEGNVYQWRGETVSKEYMIIERNGEFSLSSEGINGFRSTISSHTRWDISINDDLPITLDLELSVGEVQADLQDITINDFMVSTAVGKISLTLPEEGKVGGEIKNPIGSINIEVPLNTALRIRAEMGLTNIKVPQDYAKDGNVYTSPGYSSMENRVDLIVNQAIGIVRVEDAGD